MNPLIELTKHIKNKKLREEVVKLIKDTELSNKSFKKYNREKLERAGSVFGVSSSSMGPVERDIISHTVQVTEMSIEAAKVFEKNYGLELDKDSLVAAAILHDLMKAYEFHRDEDDDLVPTGYNACCSRALSPRLPGRCNPYSSVSSRGCRNSFTTVI